MMARRKEIWKETLLPPSQLFYRVERFFSSANEISYQGQQIFVFVLKKLVFLWIHENEDGLDTMGALTRHKAARICVEKSSYSALNAIRLELLFHVSPGECEIPRKSQRKIFCLLTF